jgi:ribosomal protein S18 acetylase RimI-like enzyme
MSVAEGYRRQGFGTAILQCLTDLAKEREYRKLFVETNNDWHYAIGFYRRFGFVEYDRDEINVYMSMSLD